MKRFSSLQEDFVSALMSAVADEAWRAAEKSGDDPDWRYWRSVRETLAALVEEIVQEAREAKS